MAYLVSLTARAERDLAHLYGEIDSGHSDAALKWYRGFKEAILSLEEQPNRCPLTPESDKRKEVEVLHIRHGARRRFKKSEVAFRPSHSYGAVTSTTADRPLSLPA